MRILYDEIMESFNGNNKYTIFLYNITASFFIILLCIYVYFANISSFKTVTFLDELINDLNKSPIFDFSLNDKYYSPYGYKKIKFGEWEGTKIGCKCQNKTNEGECSEEQKRIRCKPVYPYWPKEYYYYRGKIFSGKRFRYKSYDDLIKRNLIIQKQNNCPIGMKKCGIIDSLDNILCMKKYDDCPINDIIINNTEKIENYTSIALNDTLFFHCAGEMVNKKIVSDLFVFKGKPCYNSQEHNWEAYFPLEYESKCKTNKTENDERYGEPLDSYNQYLFYYRNFIGYNFECLNNNKVEDILSELKELRDLVEEERFFYSRIYYYFNYIIEWLGKFPLFWNETYIIIAILFWNWLIQSNKTFEIIIKLLIPEIVIIIIILYEFFSMKKPSRSVLDIIDKIYDCCDEYTKNKLKKLSKFKFKITILRGMNFIFLIAGFLFILIIFFFIIIIIILIKNFIFKRFKECSKEHKPLIEEVQDKELIDLNLH